MAWFNEGDTRAYKIRFPNGTVDVFRGWVSSIGKAVTAKEVITRTVKLPMWDVRRWQKIAAR
ncbi:phage tail tube protein [Escherichia coli]